MALKAKRKKGQPAYTTKTGGASVPPTPPSQASELFGSDTTRYIEESVKNAVGSEINKRIEQLQVKNIEQLAIFVAFFTFVSIEFQLGKNSDITDFIVFTSMFGGLLLGFIFVLHLILQEKIDWTKTLLIALFILILFVIANPLRLR